jgi:hypothetical protein
MRYLGRLKILLGRPRSRAPLGRRVARAAKHCCPNPALRRVRPSTLNLACLISKSDSYAEVTINHLDLLQKKNMASANNNSDIPSLSVLVPPQGNVGQKYNDGLPELYVGQNWPPAAAATGKYRHSTSTMRCAFTKLINSNKYIFF